MAERKADADILVTGQNMDYPIPDHMKTYMASFSKRGYIFMKTNDEWYPNFPGDLVAVSPVMKLSEYPPGAPTLYRVCVWGADDCGMEIDLPKKKDAQAIRNKIKSPISKYDLKKLGMYPA